jgi:ubiquinone/menaquinone biosynthesis C-methylase UbiE
MCQLCTLTKTMSEDALAERFIGMMNSSALALMLSIGHRTGLFDSLQTGRRYTSDELAQATGLNERYIREWFGALTTARILAHDPVEMTYWLPAEHANLLTRAAGPNNFAGIAQWLAVLGSVEDDIVQCFRKGGGVPYSRFNRFHEVMAEESNNTTVGALDEHILTLDPTLTARLEQGIDVLDLGCGRGLALVHMAQRFPKSRFVGIDFAEDAVAFARRNAQLKGLTNLVFEAMDAAKLHAENSFDFITTFDAIHDQARPDLVLGNIRRALRPGGLYLMQDIKARTAHADNMDSPLATFMYTISMMHCMTVSLSAGGMGLGAAWGREKALSMLTEAGFPHVKVEELPHDIINYYYLCRH